MQTANALNNIIRILFNPKIEDFMLFDFLVVKSNERSYLAQIVEIYDDKFDSSQNVAKLKIFYKISENNEVIPYDNFTPSKECEIVKIKQQEIENFINLDKETFIFATNAKNNTKLELQYDFFNNNPIVLGDKIEYTNTISLNIAKKLSKKKHSVIIDATSVIEHECAKKITANKDIKIPLNYSTVDFVFDRCLNNVSLEFQASIGAIINEIKRFAQKQPLEFIPFNMFLKVILEQYKATPYPELKILLTNMKKYQMDNIFARYKKDVESLTVAIEKNPVTIIDLSVLNSVWQKVYFEYLINAIKDEIYLIARVNDENCDVDLINKIYNKKKNISFIPMVSYNYKKLPSIMQYCKNYILMPSLYQRNDFLDANFALSNLISDECVIFGKNTDNFLYLARDYELVSHQEKRKNYKKIALTMADDHEKKERIENSPLEIQESDSKKLIDELTDLEEENSRKIIQNSTSEEFNDISEHITKEATDDFDEIIPKNKTQKIVYSAPKEELAANNINVSDTINSGTFLGDTNKDNIKDTDTQDFIDIKKDDIQNIKSENIEKPVSVENNKTTENSEIYEDDYLSDVGRNKTNSSVVLDDLNSDKTKTEISADKVSDTLQDGNKEVEVDLVNYNNSSNIVSELRFSDEELDFFQPSDTEEEDKTSAATGEVDLSGLSSSSLNSSFEDIIAKKNETEKDEITVEDGTKINEQLLTSRTKNEDLPIFKEEIKQEDVFEYIYNVGDKVSHSSYGVGVVVKILKYEGRQLLQIDFDELGKKTLEPRIANIKLVK